MARLLVVRVRSRGRLVQFGALGVIGRGRSFPLRTSKSGLSGAGRVIVLPCDVRGEAYGRNQETRGDPGR